MWSPDEDAYSPQAIREQEQRERRDRERLESLIRQRDANLESLKKRLSLAEEFGDAIGIAREWAKEADTCGTRFDEEDRLRFRVAKALLDCIEKLSR